MFYIIRSDLFGINLNSTQFSFAEHGETYVRNFILKRKALDIILPPDVLWLAQLTVFIVFFVCLQYRVRPGPDPRRQASETEWMTGEQIERETFQKSHGWLAAGSGTIGQLYVEVLGCNGLPNMDATPLLGTTAFGNLTDTFVVLVYEGMFELHPLVLPCHINFEFAPNSLFPINFNVTTSTK